MQRKHLIKKISGKFLMVFCLFSLTFMPVLVKAQSVDGQGTITIRLAHNALEDSIKGKMVRQFQLLIQQRLEGKVEVTVHARSVLIDDNNVAEELKSGKAEFAFPSFHDLGNVVPRFQLFDLPFLFVSEKAAENFMSGPYGVRLFRLLESNGLKSHGYVNSGMKQISSNRLIKVPGDATGLRFGIGNSAVLEKQFRALQAKSVKVSLDNMYGYLKAGNLDGYENIWHW